MGGEERENREEREREGNRGRRQDEGKDKTYILSVEKAELFAYKTDHKKSSLWDLEEKMG